MREKLFPWLILVEKVCRVCTGCKIKQEKVIGKLTAAWSTLKETKWKSVGAWLHWNACPSCELSSPDGFPPSEWGALLQLGWLHPATAIPVSCCVLGAWRPPVPITVGEEGKHGGQEAAYCCLCPKSRARRSALMLCWSSHIQVQLLRSKLRTLLIYQNFLGAVLTMGCGSCLWLMSSLWDF